MYYPENMYLCSGILQTLLESADPLNNQSIHAKDLLTGTKEGCIESFEIY